MAFLCVVNWMLSPRVASQSSGFIHFSFWIIPPLYAGLDVAPCEGAPSGTSVLNLPTRAVISDGWKSCGEVWTWTALSHDSGRGSLYCRQSKAVSLCWVCCVCQHNLSCLWPLLRSSLLSFSHKPFRQGAGFLCLVAFSVVDFCSLRARRLLADEGFLQRSTVLSSAGGFAVTFCSNAQAKMLLRTFPFFWLQFLHSGLQLYVIVYRCKTLSLSL